MSDRTLDQLMPGQTGTVTRLSGRGPARQRMLDMGLVTGAEVRVVRMAPLGDPIEFRVMGYHLSLRRDEAREVHVRLHGEDGA